MSAEHTVTLSEKVSDQKSGIVLCWQGYDISTSTVLDANYNYFFIPKSRIGTGGGVSMLVSRPTAIAIKYVYIGDQIIVGAASNYGSQVVSGITTSPNDFVLTKVYGV